MYLKLQSNYVSRLQLLHTEPSHPLIVCHGCSFTNSMTGVINRDYPYHLARIFRDEYMVCNSGLAGCGTFAHNLFLKHFPCASASLVIFQPNCPLRLLDDPKHIAIIKSLDSELTRDLKDGVKIRNFLNIVPQVMHEVFRAIEDKKHQDFSIGEQELDEIKQLRNYYKCPFIFLINKTGYPYFVQAQSSIELIKKEVAHKGDEFCITDFEGSKFVVSENDGHPNRLRAKLTAYMLSKYVSKFLG